MRWTNRGYLRTLDAIFRGAALPTNFYVMLVTAATVPDPDTNLVSELTEIAAGNGYTTGGFQLARNATDFDSLTEQDDDDRAAIQMKDVTWDASGGDIPPSGDDARYAIIVDDNGTIADREVWAFWDLGGNTSATDGDSITLQDLTLRLTPPA